MFSGLFVISITFPLDVLVTTTASHLVSLGASNCVLLQATNVFIASCMRVLLAEKEGVICKSSGSGCYIDNCVACAVGINSK